MASTSSASTDFITPVTLDDSITSKSERDVIIATILSECSEDIYGVVAKILDMPEWRFNTHISHEIFEPLYQKIGSDEFICLFKNCDKVLHQSTQARDHVKTHLQLKEFLCEECGIRFVRNQELSRHVQVSHGVPPSYPCQYCNKTYNKVGNRTRHENESCARRPGAENRG